MPRNEKSGCKILQYQMFLTICMKQIMHRHGFASTLITAAISQILPNFIFHRHSYSSHSNALKYRCRSSKTSNLRSQPDAIVTLPRLNRDLKYMTVLVNIWTSQLNHISLLCCNCTGKSYRSRYNIIHDIRKGVSPQPSVLCSLVRERPQS